jgi:hypothetical protein
MIITDYINQQVNELTFETNDFKPSLGDDITVYYNDVKIYGGVIIKIETTTEGLLNTYNVSCKDYTQYLNRKLVSERFPQSGDELITDGGFIENSGAWTYDENWHWDNPGIYFYGATGPVSQNIGAILDSLYTVSINFGNESTQPVYVSIGENANHVTFIGPGIITHNITATGNDGILYINGIDPDSIYATINNVSVKEVSDMTINTIIQYLRDEYATDFTIDNVDANINITQIDFNRIPMSQALQTLADLVGYYWYVDYDKDIHFFAKETEVAPFNLSKDAGNHNWNSLRIVNDFSQIRNLIYIVGGEYEAEERTETYIADGEQRQFPLAYKFKNIPVVKINGSILTIGIDGFDSEDNYDIFWNPSGKYIRFKESNYPNVGDLFEAIGNPLFPIIVKVPNVSSIKKYGTYEFKIIDKNIVSRADAVARGRAELSAYADSIEEGSFTTNTPGLRSGQLINVNVGDTNEDFIIQSITISMLDPFSCQWSAKIATTKTLGIIQILQKFLIQEDNIREGETLLELQQFIDSSESTDSSAITNTTSPPYLWDDPGMRWNFFTWV